MAEKGPPAPTPKPVRAKTPAPTKTKALPKPNTTRTNIPLEPKVVIRPVDQPVDQLEDQDAPHPPNQPNNLPDIPPAPPVPVINPPNPQDPQDPPNPPNLPNPPNPQNPPNPPQPQQPDNMQPPDPHQAHQLNWSYFKPEFSGKTEEDAAAHLLKTNDWMDTHNFPEDTKVRRFCLTLTGEARLWYESIRPIEMDWRALQEHFRQQHSKFGSSREQYFHVWRSFQYDENTDTIDSYILKIKQVASLLNYGEPEILELFKNTLPSKLYWILFPINNLREAVDTAKRVLNKEKLDKQLTGQASNISPFMKLGDNTLGDNIHPGQKVTINQKDLENVMSMMYNLSLQQDRAKKPFKPQVYQKKGRGQRQNYNRDRFRHNDRSGQGFIQNRHGNNYRRNGNSQNFSRNNSRDRGRRNFNRSYSSDRSRSRERSQSPRRYRQYGNVRLRSRSRSRSNPRITTNRDRIRCYKCREYDHFANECLNAMSDSDGHESDNVALQVMTTNAEPYDTHDIVRIMEDTEYLNL